MSLGKNVSVKSLSFSIDCPTISFYSESMQAEQLLARGGLVLGSEV